MTNETTPQNSPPRQMHGCLTIWLWMIIILNITGVIITVVKPSQLGDVVLPSWYLPVALTDTALVILFALALLKWRAWGFWGLVAMEGISVLIAIAESGDYTSIIGGVIGVTLLVMLLHLGGENKAWNHLK
jgi:hypothetical protein